MNEIGTLASGIFVAEFDSNTGLNSISSISGWLQNNIGALNTLIYADFSGEDPGFEDEENAIFSKLYMSVYYQKESRAALKGVTDGTNNLLEVTEGDTTVRFTNRNEVSKTYRGFARDNREELINMVGAYNMYEAKPVQVGGTEASTGIDYSDYSAS
jgi:hypothetical protein